ncbi:MAG TPA: PQQ-binding-like beta-propeller repeat protein [Gaiellaceae bacterium]|nr:PQQ-binding-like beta-propeller repeat protein [Gaiellaceae bacterium]
MRRRLLLGAAALVLLAAGGVGAYVLSLKRAEADVRGSPTVEFVTTEEEATEPEAPPAPRVLWPTYGFDNERSRAAGYRHRPPYRRLWTFGARTLVEFPPAIAYGRLYFANNNGVAYAVNAKTGRRAWKHASGRCAAASPAVHDHVIFFAFLSALPCSRGVGADRKESARLTGEVIAFASGFGRVRWRTRIGPTESSPLVANGLVYVGDWRGKVYALDERTGKVRWTFRTDGQVKGALAISGTRLFVGSYDHHLYALGARTGKLLWKAQAQRRLGKRGTFYSTPAVAYGRVYVGSTDGKVYSFGAASGKLRWSHDTGGYVYSSPAVWRRLVFAGSYDEHLYAFDAATGDVRWKFRANGEISGSPTVVGGIVYFATLKERTYALDARTGRRLWSYPDGKYTPVVADAERLYLVGHARVYGMVGRR